MYSGRKESEEQIFRIDSLFNSRVERKAWIQIYAVSMCSMITKLSEH